MYDTIQVRDRGVLTLPAGVRKRHGIRSGDSYRLIDFDGILVLTPLTPVVPELAYEIERLRREAGVSAEEMIRGIREQRARYVLERYGDEPGSDEETD